MKLTALSIRRGAMLPFIAFCMIVLFVAVTLAVDIARIHLTRAELRTATDAAARAGVEALSRKQDVQAAVDAAIEIASRNSVAGKGLTIQKNQVVLGRATPTNSGLFDFKQENVGINSIRVTGSRKDGSADGPVSLLFGPLFGVSTFEPIQTSSAMRTERDIALVLDVSGSMNNFGRFPALKKALAAFLQELKMTPQEEIVSLTVYSTTSRKRVNLTTNLQLISDTFNQEVPNGFTAIGEGLKTGLASLSNDPLSRKFADKAIVLMTDGNQNTGESPELVAMRTKGVTIHAVTLGAEANQALMRRVAKPSGGIYMHAENGEQLEGAFREIARQLSVLLID